MSLDDEEVRSEIDDYYHSFHQAKQSIALTREFFDQRTEYLLDSIASPKALKASDYDREKKRKKREREKRKKKKRRKRDKRQRVNDDDNESENTYYAQLEFKEKGWKKHQRIATEASIASKIESVTSHTLKPNIPMSPSMASSTMKTKKQQTTNEYNGYIDYHSDSDDFGVFDIADFAKQIKKKPNNEHTKKQSQQKLSKEERRRIKKWQKKEKKRMEKERKRKLKQKEKEIEEIEKKMYQKRASSKSSKTGSSQSQSQSRSSSKYKSNFHQNKPKVITIYNNNEKVTKLNHSQTSPARAGIFEFDSIPNINASDKNHEIDTEDFHIVVVGNSQRSNSNHSQIKIPPKPMYKNVSNTIENSKSATIPNIPSNLEAPPSVAPIISDIDTETSTKKIEKINKDSSDSNASSSTSTSTSSEDENDEMNVDDLVISEMAPSPSCAPMNNSFDASPINVNQSNVHQMNVSNVNLRKYGNDRRGVINFDNSEQHQYVPSMALSLLGGFENLSKNALNAANGQNSIKDSPFFDPAFWNNDFEKRKEQRKRHFTMNLTKIDFMDYAVIDVMDNNEKKSTKNRRKQTEFEMDLSRQQTVQHHAKTVTKMKLEKFAKKDMFVDDIHSIFDPKYNQKWIRALCGEDKEHNVLHLVDDELSKNNSHKRKTTMMHWENFDNANMTKQSIKNGDDHLSLVPQLIFFSKSFFQTKEAQFIFVKVKRGIEILINDKSTKIKMIQQLHAAFERDFDQNRYVEPQYSELQVLEKQIVWVGEVKDALNKNPFLSDKAFDNEQARSDYLNEFRAQLDEETIDLIAQHSKTSKQAQNRASILLKKVKFSKMYKFKRSKTKKRLRLFGWFRKSKKKKIEKKNSNDDDDDEKYSKPELSKRESSNRLQYRTRTPLSPQSSASVPSYVQMQSQIIANDILPKNVNMDCYSLYFILLCLLLRHYNNGRNFLIFSISSTSVRMPELGDRILDIFGIMTKCGIIYRCLCYLKICTKVLATEAAYFDDVYQRLTQIAAYLDEDEHGLKLLTLREKLHLKKVITRMSNWCKLCITRYQHVFFGATGPRALKSCLRCWKFCFSLLYKLNNLDTGKSNDKFERKWCKKVKEIIKKSIFDYEFPRLVQLYKTEPIGTTNNNFTNGPSFFYSKQTYNQQYAQLKKMKQKKDSLKPTKATKDTLKPTNVSSKKRQSASSKILEFSKKLIHSDKNKKQKNKQKVDNMSETSLSSSTSSVFLDSPVDDATQLIMVIKGCRKYLVLDGEEYESAFKSYCTHKEFSLLKIASSQYMTLAFSFTNLYLRVLAFGIQEKIEERRQNLEFAAKNYKNLKKSKKRRKSQKNNNTEEAAEETTMSTMTADEMNKFLENTDFEIDPSVWALYQELKRFYDDLKIIYKGLKKQKITAKLPEVRYSDHYNDIIAYWCQYQEIKFTNPYNGYVHKLTSNENWKKISDNALYSTSVIDLFTLIDPLQHWFLNLPYTNENLLDFAKLLTSIVKAYVNTLHEKVSKYLLKELEKKELAFYSKKRNTNMVVWNFPMKLMVAVNNIIMAKTQLQATISKLMLDRRYTLIANKKKKEQQMAAENESDNGTVIRKQTHQHHTKSQHTSLARYHTLKQTILFSPTAVDGMSTFPESTLHGKVDSNGTATTFYKHKILPSEFDYNYFDDENDIDSWNNLNCVDAFQTINRSLSSISFLVAQGLNSDISHEVFLLLWENERFPPHMSLTKEQVEDELMDMLWKKLCTKCDLLNENISPLFTPYILTDFFSSICLDFIKLTIPKREKYVLNLNQLLRIEFAINEIQNFLLDCYNLEAALVQENENLYRLKHIINLQLGGTKIICSHHDALDKDPDWTEKYQLDNEPFIGPKSLWLIIKHRVKHHKHDAVLHKYYEQHTGIKAQINHFTQAVRGIWG